MTPALRPSLWRGEPSPSHWFSDLEKTCRADSSPNLTETERYRKIPNVTMAFVTCGQVLPAARKVGAVTRLALGNEVWSMMKGFLLGGKEESGHSLASHAPFVLAGHSTEPVSGRSTVSKVSYGTPGSRALLLQYTY